MRARGFTLIEVLLAIAIVVMVGAMTAAGLRAATDAAERYSEQVRRLGELQTAVAWLVRDLRESIDRPVLDAAGETLPSMEGPREGDIKLELTRIGWDNPRGQRRGSVQRVRYRLDANGDLWREHWLVLDRFDDETEVQSVRLLRGVDQCTLQFLDAKATNAQQQPLGGEWAEQWPSTPGNMLMPLAVQFELDIQGIGTVRRVVELANEQTQ